MATRSFLSGCLVAALLLSGCALHRHRVGSDGVHFYLRHRSAKSVAICSSLDGFRAHAAKRTAGGLWETVLPAEAPFSYFYLVDDHPFVPDCALTESDGFGAKNCIFDPDV